MAIGRLMDISWSLITFIKIASDWFMMATGCYCTLLEDSVIEKCEVMNLTEGIYDVMWYYTNSYNFLTALYCFLLMVMIHEGRGWPGIDGISFNIFKHLFYKMPGVRRTKMISKEMMIWGICFAMIGSVIWKFGSERDDWILVFTEIGSICMNTVFISYLLRLDLDDSSIRRGVLSALCLDRYHNGDMENPNVSHGYDRIRIDEEEDDTNNSAMPDGTNSSTMPDGIDGIEEYRNHKHEPKDMIRIKDCIKVGVLAIISHNIAYLFYDLSVLTLRTVSQDAATRSVKLSAFFSSVIVYYRLTCVKLAYKKF